MCEQALCVSVHAWLFHSPWKQQLTSRRSCGSCSDDRRDVPVASVVHGLVDWKSAGAATGAGALSSLVAPVMERLRRWLITRSVAAGLPSGAVWRSGSARRCAASARDSKAGEPWSRQHIRWVLTSSCSWPRAAYLTLSSAAVHAHVDKWTSMPWEWCCCCCCYCCSCSGDVTVQQWSQAEGLCTGLY